MSGDNDILLSVEDLSTEFTTEEGVVRAVDGVSWTIRRGETVALVGESGCGKSVTALSIMRLIADPPGRIAAGRIVFDGQDLLELPEAKMRAVRGNRIAMIFQEPMSSLNPVYTIGDQIIEAIELHQRLRGAAARSRAIEMLVKVGIPAPDQRIDEYPHQMSGGMRQRVMIAMALSCNPDLLIADEPTTALDVTIQAQILDLLRQLQRDTGMAILMITHDLGVVAEIARRVCVMYASKIVEMADVGELFADPRHPYTQGLFKSIPRLSQRKTRLDVIPGNVPNPINFPTGCKFHPRCSVGYEDTQCRETEPWLDEIGNRRWVRCWKSEGFGSGKNVPT